MQSTAGPGRGIKGGARLWEPALRSCLYREIVHLALLPYHLCIWKEKSLCSRIESRQGDTIATADNNHSLHRQGLTLYLYSPRHDRLSVLFGFLGTSITVLLLEVSLPVIQPAVCLNAAWGFEIIHIHRETSNHS